MCVYKLYYMSVYFTELFYVPVDIRMSLHEKFLLPMNQPIFRRSNAVTFTTEGYKNFAEGYLCNTHEGLKNPSEYSLL